MGIHSNNYFDAQHRGDLPKVLAVDDVYLSLLLIKEALAGLVNLYIARSAGDAIKILDLIDLDLLLLDLEMPEMNGFDFLEQMHSMPNHKKIPVIIVSSNSKLQTLKKTLEYDVVDYVVKPFELPLLREKVAKALSNICN